MQEFLAKNKHSVVEQMNAKNQPLGRNEAIQVLTQAAKVHVVKGKQVLSFDMKSADLDEVLAVALGPTGNLRAPALRKGSTLVIGYNEDIYRATFG